MCPRARVRTLAPALLREASTGVTFANLIFGTRYGVAVRRNARRLFLFRHRSTPEYMQSFTVKKARIVRTHGISCGFCGQNQRFHTSPLGFYAYRTRYVSAKSRLNLTAIYCGVQNIWTIYMVDFFKFGA